MFACPSVCALRSSEISMHDSDVDSVAYHRSLAAASNTLEPALRLFYDRLRSPAGVSA